MDTKTFSPIINEEEIQHMWDSSDTFKKSVDKEAESNFTFYDGPPFATGLPHYGHILAGFIKDTIGRYQTQNSKSVSRRAGWDCHGLPIEYEIEKAHGIKTRQQVEDWGISNYNEACKEIVMTYASEWETIMNRLGRWVDFKDDYKTMDFDFMNSVWWVFSELAKKGLVYPSYRVMPYSVVCRTPLSNFETQQNYQEIEDQTLFVKFKLIDQTKVFGNLHNFPDNCHLLVWTTTPWTLPSNLACAINPNISYNLVKLITEQSTDETYIIASSLVEKTFNLAKKSYEIISEFNGSELIGLKYEPPFKSYPTDQISNIKLAFSVIGADFVTASDGTGIVHIAPSYGEEDYNACIKNGLIFKSDELFMSIDDQGYFVHQLESIEDLGGVFYKHNELTKSSTSDANTMIIKKLKQSDRVFFQNKYKHSYPFCWRSDTPLMYRAIKSWFVNVEKIKDRMVELNKKINWVPSSIGKGRFHQWLSQAKDWCIARNRYWGTPIPIWANVNDYSDYKVIQSAGELEKLCGLKSGTITDLHRDKIDHLTFESNGSTYKRINEIFDCWFESGSMPYASIGYPYKTTSINFPADFIAEGIDQTRGWFYTLLVISTALFDSVPFKNVVVNGLILASDGKKMSKRLKNYPDPLDVVNKYGSDALRLYLLNSPATKGDVLKFNESGVQLMVKEVIIPLKNSLKFLIEYKTKFELEYPNEQLYTIHNYKTDNPLDAYAIKYIGTLIDSINSNLSDYNLSEAVRQIVRFVDMLNNQFIKFNRYALKSKYGFESWKSSLSILNIILEYFAVNTASLIPYLSEYIFQILNSDKSISSVHLTNFKDYQMPNIDSEINNDPNLNNMADEMIHVINIIDQVLSIRSKNNINMKTPLEQIIVRTSDNICLILKKYSNFILDELNILNLKVDEFDWELIKINLRPNFQSLKLTYRTEIDIKEITESIKLIQSSSDHKYNLAQGKDIKVDRFLIKPSMFNIMIEPNIMENYKSQYSYNSGYNYCVDLNINQTEQIKELYYARVLATTFQKMRKNANLHSWDVIKIGYIGHLKYPIEKLEQTIKDICGYTIDELNQDSLTVLDIIFKFESDDLHELLKEKDLKLYLYK